MKTIKEKNKIAKEEAESYIERFKDVLSCDMMGYSVRPKVFPSNEDTYKLIKDACFLAMEHLNLKRLGCFDIYGDFENKYAKKKFQYYDKIYNQVVKIRKQVKK